MRLVEICGDLVRLVEICGEIGGDLWRFCGDLW